MEKKQVYVVFDVESDDAPMPLGKYLYTNEDAVVYMPAGSNASRSAPADCVAVVPVTVMV